MMRILYADDCLNVLKDETALPTGSVDLIYLDPPFKSDQHYNLPFKGELNKDLKPVEAFKDTWTWSEKEQESLESLKEGPRNSLLYDLITLSRSVSNERGGAEACRPIWSI